MITFPFPKLWHNPYRPSVLGLLSKFRSNRANASFSRNATTTALPRQMLVPRGTLKALPSSVYMLSKCRTYPSNLAGRYIGKEEEEIGLVKRELMIWKRRFHLLQELAMLTECLSPLLLRIVTPNSIAVWTKTAVNLLRPAAVCQSDKPLCRFRLASIHNLDRQRLTNVVLARATFGPTGTEHS